MSKVKNCSTKDFAKGQLQAGLNSKVTAATVMGPIKKK